MSAVPSMKENAQIITARLGNTAQRTSAMAADTLLGNTKLLEFVAADDNPEDGLQDVRDMLRGTIEEGKNMSLAKATDLMIEQTSDEDFGVLKALAMFKLVTTIEGDWPVTHAGLFANLVAAISADPLNARVALYCSRAICCLVKLGPEEQEQAASAGVIEAMLKVMADHAADENVIPQACFTILRVIEGDFLLGAHTGAVGAFQMPVGLMLRHSGDAAVVSVCSKVLINLLRDVASIRKLAGQTDEVLQALLAAIRDVKGCCADALKSCFIALVSFIQVSDQNMERAVAAGAIKAVTEAAEKHQASIGVNGVESIACCVFVEFLHYDAGNKKQMALCGAVEIACRVLQMSASSVPSRRGDVLVALALMLEDSHASLLARAVAAGAVESVAAILQQHKIPQSGIPQSGIDSDTVTNWASRILYNILKPAPELYSRRAIAAGVIEAVVDVLRREPDNVCLHSYGWNILDRIISQEKYDDPPLLARMRTSGLFEVLADTQANFRSHPILGILTATFRQSFAREAELVSEFDATMGITAAASARPAAAAQGAATPAVEAAQRRRGRPRSSAQQGSPHAAAPTPEEFAAADAAAAALLAEEEAASAKREKARQKKQRQKANRHAAAGSEPAAAQGERSSCAGSRCVADSTAARAAADEGFQSQTFVPPRPPPPSPAAAANQSSGSVEISVDLLPDFLRRRRPAATAPAVDAAADTPAVDAAADTPAPGAAAPLGAAAAPPAADAALLPSGAFLPSTGVGSSSKAPPALAPLPDAPAFLRPGAADAALAASLVAQMAQMQEQMERMRLDAARAEAEARRLREERENGLCGVCFDRERTAILIPCGHTYCSECVEQLPKRVCPECVQPFSRAQRLYGLGSSSA